MNTQHFTAAEYREWSDDMSPRLVTMMDVLRFMCGRPIEISASSYALGRELGPDDLSTHNVDRWGGAGQRLFCVWRVLSWIWPGV